MDVRRFSIAVLVATVMSAQLMGQSTHDSIKHAITVVPIVSQRTHPSLHSGLQVTGQGKPCNVKRHALIGAAIGGVSGMVIAQKIAKSEGGHAGAKGTVYAGGYGAVIGAFVGLKTCN